LEKAVDFNQLVSLLHRQQFSLSFETPKEGEHVLPCCRPGAGRVSAEQASWESVSCQPRAAGVGAWPCQPGTAVQKWISARKAQRWKMGM